MDTEQIISVENISKSFGRKLVLRNISFSVKRSSLTGIEGENGSGKTTLLNIMAGFWKADNGNLDIKGSVGFCPQIPMLFMQLSVEENIRFFSRAYGIEKKQGHDISRNKLNELFTTFRYNEPLSQKCYRLSGGTLQKLNLIISLLHDPDILLLDEPYAAFDWETYKAFWNYSIDLKKQGKAVVIISHIVYDRDNFDRILTLEEGGIS
jgi:ABC-2 type transport system ATP-binding protein